MIDHCTWSDGDNHPNRYIGDTVEAISHYDLPPDVRAKLVAKVAKHDKDDVVLIKRDSIKGLYSYSPEMREMMFKQSSMCKTVSRAAWTDQSSQQAMIYIVTGDDGKRYAWGVASVCGNPFRLDVEESPVAPFALSILPLAAPVVPESALVGPGGPVGYAENPGSSEIYQGGGYVAAPFPGGGYFVGGGGAGGYAPGAPCDCLCPPVLVPAVPEPESWMLLGLGLALLAGLRRRLTGR